MASHYCRSLLVLACLAAFLSLAVAQYFPFFGHGGPARDHLAAANTRDPRGPVVFPPSAPGSETSGVRVGASGYGFVPAPPRGGSQGRFASYNIW